MIPMVNSECCQPNRPLFAEYFLGEIRHGKDGKGVLQRFHRLSIEFSNLRAMSTRSTSATSAPRRSGSAIAPYIEAGHRVTGAKAKAARANPRPRGRLAAPRRFADGPALVNCDYVK